MKNLFICFMAVLGGWYCGAHLIPWTQAMLYNSTHESFFKGSYIYEIDMPIEKRMQVIQTLNDFDDMTVQNIVKFSGDRPIIISEGRLDHDYIGLAEIALTACFITIDPTLEGEEFTDILLHEYIHCMGFEHTNTPCDLMHPNYQVCVNDSNRKKYADLIGIIMK